MKCKNKNCNEEAEWCDKCMNLISKENKQLKKLRNSALRQVEEMQDAQVEIVNKLQEENRHLKVLHKDSCKKLGESLNEIFLQRMDFIKELEKILNRIKKVLSDDTYGDEEILAMWDYEIRKLINKLKGDGK